MRYLICTGDCDLLLILIYTVGLRNSASADLTNPPHQPNPITNPVSPVLHLFYRQNRLLLRKEQATCFTCSSQLSPIYKLLTHLCHLIFTCYQAQINLYSQKNRRYPLPLQTYKEGWFTLPLDTASTAQRSQRDYFPAHSQSAFYRANQEH